MIIFLIVASVGVTLIQLLSNCSEDTDSPGDHTVRGTTATQLFARRIVPHALRHASSDDDVVVGDGVPNDEGLGRTCR